MLRSQHNVSPKDDDPGIDYPRTILSDARTARFVDGVAFIATPVYRRNVDIFTVSSRKLRFTSPKVDLWNT
ncbi:MAG: hypothetical protein IPJ07_26770 [Acidobacteria bacterium]|nr:hypothetical protein [Acidobacteriota bacterium]